MKKTVTYLFIVFLASLIFYGGAGVNFVTYCCNDCRTEGVAVLLNDNCCEVHGHGCCDTTTEEASCSSGCCEDDCCDLERISFECFKDCQFELSPYQRDFAITGLFAVSFN